MRQPRSPWRRRRPTAVVAAGISLLLTTTGLAAFATPAAAAPAAPMSPARPLDEPHALAQAKSSGKPVDVTAATTPTETLTAEPDGSLTLTQAVQPVRKLVAGGWRDLDATLTVAPDGSIGPKTAVGDLHLSGGGTGAFATMAGGGRSLALTAPFALPKPTLAGDTATYAGVLPGVDLRVTADTQGGFSEVFVVADAAAAANPRLSKLTFGTQATGIRLAADAAGNITGTDAAGHAVVTAATPQMWDSTTSPAPSRSGLRTFSSNRAPGSAARIARIGTGASPQGITLSPDRTLLSGSGVKWPVYIDPTFTWLASGSAVGGWAVISKLHPGTNYYKDSPSNTNDMQSGHDPDTGDVRRTMLNFGIDTSRLSGATINDATLNITETWSYNCSASLVDLYAPSKDLTSSTSNWDDWDGVSLGSRVDQQNVAHGWSSDCKAAGVPFDILSAVKADASSGNKTQTFVVKADSETSDSGWKRWDKGTPKITIHYDHAPSKPTGLKTSPTTSCTGSAIGDTAVKLYATVSDPDGGTVGITYKIWQTSKTSVTKSSDPNGLTGPSGTSAVPFTVDESWFKTAAAGVPTRFSWNVTTTDFKYTSAASSTCTFTWDPTRQGPPVLADPTDPEIGLPLDVGVTFTKANPTDTVPGSYQFQLNGGPVGTVTADSAGTATVTVTPRRFTNVLTVTSVSAGHNIGDTAAVTFLASPTTTSVDGEMTGDGIPDLLTVGGTNNLPPGLWLAPGTGNAAPGLNVLGSNLGIAGNGTQGDDLPSDFNGAQAFTGHFTGGGLQDILYYYPTGTNAGGGGVLNGNGDGSPVFADQSGTQHTISAGAFSDWNNDNPAVLANAGSPSGGAYPDLIGVVGDPANGYALDYYVNQGGLLDYDFPVTLSVPAPDGTLNWGDWTLTSAQLADGTVDMYLWDRTDGALHLWSDLTYDVNTQTFGYASDTTLADGTATHFTQSSTATIQAGDINRDGTPDLWVVGPSQAATAYIVGNVAVTGTGTGMLTAQPAQTLNTSAHTWLLNDGTDDDSTTNPAVGTARDAVGTLTGTGSGGATWNQGDMWDPDVRFDGGTGAITAAKAVTTNADFSVSFWAKPDAYNGTVVSQEGTNGVGFRVYPASDGTWDFAMQRGDTASASAVWDTAKSAAGTAGIGVWYHVTATYTASTKAMAIYVNDKLAGSATHTTPWSAGGSFRIGTMRISSSAFGNYFKGQVADVQTWNTVVNPAPYVADAPVGDGPEMAYDNGGASMRMYRWNSSGKAFDRSTDYTSGAFSLSNVGNRMASGDVDGDGHDDVVMAYQQSNGTFVFYVWRYGNSAAQIWYTSGPFNLANVGGRIVLGDFNGDGKAEPALAYDQGDGTMRIYRWLSTGTSFARTDDYDSGAFHLSNVGDRMVAGDVNGDGKDDIVMAYQLTDGTFGYYVWKNGNSAAEVWWTSGIFNLDNVAGRMVMGDFNGDGKAEPALVYDNGNHTMKIYRWFSSGTAFTRTTDYNSGTFLLSNVGDRVAVGDIDNDGDDDIAMAYQQTNGGFSYYTWRNGGGSAQIWYTYANLNLANVGGRLVLGHW